MSPDPLEETDPLTIPAHLWFSEEHLRDVPGLVPTAADVESVHQSLTYKGDLMPKVEELQAENDLLKQQNERLLDQNNALRQERERQNTGRVDPRYSQPQAMCRPSSGKDRLRQEIEVHRFRADAMERLLMQLPSDLSPEADEGLRELMNMLYHR